MESRVKVGVRVRPLVSKEKSQHLTIEQTDSDSLVFKGQQTFTFDHVFGIDLSQQQLYDETAAPMLRSFLDGYHCTIICYGQVRLDFLFLSILYNICIVLYIFYTLIGVP
jgi:hypothetical protein